MQQVLFEVSHQDQVFIEDECMKHGYTYSTFLIKLLELYRGAVSESEVTPVVSHQDTTDTTVEPPKKRKGRQKKND